MTSSALRDALASRAGWDPAKDAAADITAWVQQPFTGAALSRPGEPVTILPSALGGGG